MIDLPQAAIQARRNAHAPYSNFKVGAALLTRDGRLFTGCNIENATYGLTVCAERVAVFTAIAAGCQPRDFAAIAVAAATPHVTPPCGACRQILWEFCGDIPVTMTNLEGRVETCSLADLFPKGFDEASLAQSPSR
jgi:cytidine deaminase